ncbi:glycine betaine/L-proline ABC transporter ATP-binding protein ProV [Thiothrix litoralis]|uniref:Quaternary amine transport ATP-binding protein n=1 Tax=Thiothrix litoralis TaxID=2891210 RepID=A0ABX7WT12_9GAMM|nr:glycine betaine/L-proline ABC transporter ATP-binding protein ProV [Thiothrix litoralis]QTR46834.1 glycine betaine/L-proline ABC transporter ATP-binding protein ProV [Thiothrix litoralis]
MKVKLSVKGLYKIFGEEPERAWELLEQGMSKAAIFEKTGLTLGVQDAGFDIYEGEIFVIMGLSGSGKSTLVRLLNRLIEPTAGQVLLDDVDIAGLSAEALREARRKKISMVFQSFALMPHMSVIDNVAFGLELDGMAREERVVRARSALEQVGLSAYEDSYPDELSGGMQQRVGLARALANDPAILLMDEAFSALDPLIRTEMQDELLKLQEEHQRTIVFISHDLDEAMRIGDRIAIMEGGCVVQVDSPDNILANPANDYVRSFFRGVDVSTVLTAGDVARKKQVTLIEREGANIRTAATRLRENDRNYGFVLDRGKHFHGVVSVDSLTAVNHRDGAKLHDAFLVGVTPLQASTQLSEIIGLVAQSDIGLPVVDDAGIYKGAITKTLLLETLNRGGE